MRLQLAVRKAEFPHLREARSRADTMGMPARAQTYYTVDEVQAFLEDGNRYELIYGELVVSPSPRKWHQEVVMRLTHLLLDYCRVEPVGEVFNVDADLTWGRNDVLTQPDVFVLSLQDRDVERWEDVRNVPLIAEVLSKSTARHDRFGKRVVYRDQRVDTYWIVDADAHSVEVWTPDAQFPRVEHERLVWAPIGAGHPLVIALATLFADG